MIGFTFAYGSMFAKVWIVHRMSASENQELALITKEEVCLRVINKLSKIRPKNLIVVCHYPSIPLFLHPSHHFFFVILIRKILFYEIYFYKMQPYLNAKKTKLHTFFHKCKFF